MRKLRIVVAAFILTISAKSIYAKEALAKSNFESASVTVLEPSSIAVEEIISDPKIQQRIRDILLAIGSYQEVDVKIVSGVAILSGLVDNESQIEWINNLVNRMDGVVAVQNQIRSRPKKILDIAPAMEEIEVFNVAFMRRLPTIGLALSVLIISILLFFLASFGFRRAFNKKISSPLLLNATAKVLSVPVLLLGLYLSLKISGLTGLAFTVLGGTGLLGLVLGLGLKNSFEDYAASILLSIKKTFSLERLGKNWRLRRYCAESDLTLNTNHRFRRQPHTHAEQHCLQQYYYQ